MKSMKS